MTKRSIRPRRPSTVPVASRDRENAERAAQQRELTDTRNAQPALGLVEMALFRWLQALGLRGDGRHEDRRVGRRDERRVVVLPGGEDVQADLLGLQGDLHRVADALALGGGAAGGGVGGDVPDGEDAELHDPPDGQVEKM